MILDTDMSRHFQTLKDLQEKLGKSEASASTFCASDPENQTYSLAILLHCCDLGNPTKDWVTYRRWTNSVMEEFYAQAESEKAHGRDPTMPGRDVRLDKFQLGFLGFIKPFFVSVNKIDGIEISHLISNLDANVERWKGWASS